MKKSVIELREIAKERKIKGISTLKKKELIETLEKYDQENYKEVKSKEETHGEHQGRKHYQKEFPKNNQEPGQWTESTWNSGSYAGWLWIYSL